MDRFRYAFSLSRDEVHNATPPGTKILINNELVRSETGHHEHEEKRVHLQPEPSSDPRDPLNLPFWRKVIVLLLMSGYAFVSTGSSAVLSSALPSLVTAFADFPPDGPPTGLVPFSDLTHLMAVNSLMLGGAGIWLVPLANIFGRRLVILISLLLMTGFSFWCAEAQSFNSLLAARVFQGCGAAAAELLAPDVVGRVFFVHQMGRAMAVYTAFLASGSLLAGCLGGYITESLSWRWTMWIPGIMAGGLFVLTFIFVPETLFDRERALAEQGRHTAVESHLTDKGSAETAEHVAVEGGDQHPRPHLSFVQSLEFPRPRDHWLREFLSPYQVLRFPGTIMVMLHYAGLIGLIVTISTVGPQILAAPPYLWGANDGLINVGGLVGTVLGAAYTYLTTDWLTKRSAGREQHGFAEPEERLPLLFPSLVVSTAGALVFGFCAQNPSSLAWVGLQFGLGMVAFGLMQVPSVGFNYIIEAYGNWASACFLMIVAFRSIISFAWIFFVGSWIAEVGYAEPFGIFGMLMGLFAFTAVPIWLYGKRLRIATASWVSARDK